jgi:hypothetical protein
LGALVAVCSLSWGSLDDHILPQWMNNASEALLLSPLKSRGVTLFRLHWDGKL